MELSKIGVVMVPLEQVQPNPYQTRLREDAEHVRKIADSIKVQGLLQIPVGRIRMHETMWNPENYIERGGQVELAFGHTRLAAFKLLAGESTSLEDRVAYEAMPVAVRDLDDLEMFQMAISENLARKDLSPIEQAQAMKDYRDKFQKTSEQIGELFGMSDSTVRHKIRLLDLPEEVSQALDDGRITEGMGKAILTLLGLPESIRIKAEEEWESPYYLGRGEFQRPSTGIRLALEGKIGTEQMAAFIERVIMRNATQLSGAPWKWDTVESGENIAHPQCKDCPKRFEKGSTSHCMDRTCYKERQKRYKQRYLETASLASGIPALDEGKEYITSFDRYSHQRYFDEIQKRGCSNLRLVYDESKPASDEKTQRIAGHTRARIICQKREGSCTCIQGLKISGVDAFATPAPAIEKASVPAGTLEGDDNIAPDLIGAQVAVNEAAGEPTPLGEVELKEIARKIKAQKRQNKEEVRGMLDAAAARILEGIAANNLEVWRTIARRFASYSEEKQFKEMSLVDLQLVIARNIAARSGYDPNDAYGSSLAEENPERCLLKYNDLMKELGMDPIGSYDADQR